MPPRSSFKGFLKLSLVSVPVKAYTANSTGAEITLNQLHGKCNHRIRYVKTCPEHGEVPAEEIVSGYEYSKGQYAIVDVEELEKLRTHADRSINIHGFLPDDVLDPIYHSGRTYYLLPDGAVGQKPYALLREVMKAEGLCALAEVVLSGREQLVLLRPVESLLALVILSHEGKVKQPSSFTDELTEMTQSKEELSLTRTLIQASRIKSFDYGKYKDGYVEKLTRLIQTKVEGREVVAEPDTEEPKIINLIEALKLSVAQAQKAGTPSARKREAKMAPSAADKPAKVKKRKSG